MVFAFELLDVCVPVPVPVPVAEPETPSSVVASTLILVLAAPVLFTELDKFLGM